MKKILILILTLISIKTFALEESIKEDRNLKLGFNTHEATLMGSEKVKPVYTEIKYNFMKGRKVSPFVVGNMGFSYVDEMEDQGKIKDMRENNYYSMGAGLDINHLTMEVSYATYELGYQGKEEESSENRITLKLKYRY